VYAGKAKLCRHLRGRYCTCGRVPHVDIHKVRGRYYAHVVCSSCGATGPETSGVSVQVARVLAVVAWTEAKRLAAEQPKEGVAHGETFDVPNL